MAILRLTETPRIQLHELAETMRPESLPIVADDIAEWTPLFDFFDVIGRNNDWLGYSVRSERFLIVHPTYFMGKRAKQDHRYGHLNFVEVTGATGVFRFSVLEPKGEHTLFEVRATSKDFLDMIFIMAKTSLD